MKHAALVLAVLVVMASCVSTPPGAGTAAPEPVAKDSDVAALMAKAAESIDSNRLAEGVRFYVSARGKADEAGLRARVAEIEALLGEIAGRLTVEPHENWVGPDGAQLTGNSRDLSKGSGIMPAVYLYESYGFAKSPVPDAVIRFEFVANSGGLTQSVSTDAKGMANTTITSITAAGKDAVVRAYPVFSSDGYSYALTGVYRDFGYLAPPNVALVAALERTPAGDSENPRVLDAVAEALKPLGVQPVPLNGVVSTPRFMAAFGGDPSSLAALSPAVKAGYYALVLVEVTKPTQMEYGGKTYNIFIARGKFTLRIVRADGTVVHSEVKDYIRGQGTNDTEAVAACLVTVRDELVKAIGAGSAAITTALSQ